MENVNFSVNIQLTFLACLQKNPKLRLQIFLECFCGYVFQPSNYGDLWSYYHRNKPKLLGSYHHLVLIFSELCIVSLDIHKVDLRILLSHIVEAKICCSHNKVRS